MTNWFRGWLLAMAALLLCANVASAQEGWHGQPGEYVGQGDDIRTVWAQQPEYVYRPGYWSIGWAIGPSGYYQQMRFWHRPGERFTGRVTLQTQTRVYRTFTRGNATYTGWSDINYGLFR